MHQITESFKINSNIPIDARFVVDSLANLLEIPAYKLYDGIIVYNKDNKSFYTYDSTITPDSTLGKWRLMELFGLNVDHVEMNSENHMIVHYTDRSTVDLGLVKGEKGDKGDKGDGFVIVKIYDSEESMLNDENPVNNGQLVALVTSTAVLAYVRNTSQGNDSNSLSMEGYTFLTNVVNASVIKGEKGDQGDAGDDGVTPTIVSTYFPQSDTENAGHEIKFYLDDLNTPVSTYKVYNGSSPVITTQEVAATETTNSGNLVTIKNGPDTRQFTVYNGKNGTNGTDGTNGISIVDTWVDNDDTKETYRHILVKLSNGTILDAGAVDIEIANLDFLIEVVDELPGEPDEGKIYVVLGNVTSTPGQDGGSPSSSGVSGSGAIFIENMYKTANIPPATELSPEQKIIDKDLMILYTVTDMYTYTQEEVKSNTLYGNNYDKKFYTLVGDALTPFSDTPGLKQDSKNIIQIVNGELYAEADKVLLSEKTDNTIGFDTDGKSLYVPRVKISTNANNNISFATDGTGLYVPKVSVSQEENNLLTSKTDGLFVDGTAMTTAEETALANEIITTVFGPITE